MTDKRVSTLKRLARVKTGGVVAKQHGGGWLVLVGDLVPAREVLRELGLTLHTAKTAPPLYIPMDNETDPGRRVPRASLYGDQVYASIDEICYFPAKGVYDQIRFFFTEKGEFNQPALYTNGRNMHPVSLINRRAPLVEFYRWTRMLNKRLVIHTAITTGGTITPPGLRQIGGNVRLTIMAEQLFKAGHDANAAFGELVDKGVVVTDHGTPHMRMLSLASVHYYVHPTHLVTKYGLTNNLANRE